MSRYRGKREGEADRLLRKKAQKRARRLRKRAVDPVQRKRKRLIGLGVAAGVLLLIVIVHSLIVHRPDMKGPGKNDGPETEGMAERNEGSYTFLLLGVDKAAENTDTIMVATYDTVNQALNVMSIPRDTMVNLPWDVKKINSVYNQQGIDGLKEQIKGITGFAPDFYVEIDLEAFVVLVDEIGGVKFNVPQDMRYKDPYQDLVIDLKAGEQVLDGQNAMGLVRFRRYASGDIGRIDVQQDFLKALIKQCLSLENWSKISSYIRIFNDYVESDLALGEMLWFGEKAMGLNMDNVNFMTLPGNYGAYAWSRSMGQNLSYVTINTEEALEMLNTYFNPYGVPITRDMLDIMSINSDGTLSSTSGVVLDSKASQGMPAGGYRPADGEEEPGEEVVEDPENTDDPALEDPENPDEPSTGEEITEPEGGEGQEPSDPVEDDPVEGDPVVEPADPQLPAEPDAPAA